MQQWVKKIENGIGVQISQLASREKTALAEVGTILGRVNSPLHQDRVRVQRQKRRFTTIRSRNWFTDSGGYQPTIRPGAHAEAQAQAQAAESKED